MTTKQISEGITMHQSHDGMKCMGDDVGCAEETAVFYRGIVARSGPTPMSDISRLRVMAYLNNRDGDVLDGTNFMHLRNVEESNIWCPMAEFALEFVPGWTCDKFESLGLVEFLTALVRLCASCGKSNTTRCSRCKRIRYCTVACQRSDWNHHKKYCINM